MNEQIYELIISQLQSAIEVMKTENIRDYKLGYYESTIEHIMVDMRKLKK